MAEFTQFLFYEKLRDNGLKGALIFIKSQIKQFKNPENQKSNEFNEDINILKHNSDKQATDRKSLLRVFAF